MKKQQTAVDWVVEKLDNLLELYPSEWKKVNELIEQAKEMEKEQIIASHINGNVEYTVGGNYWKVAEQYYNKTYKNETITS